MTEEPLHIPVIAGIVVRELTQLVIDYWHIESRSAKLLLSVLFTVVMAALLVAAGLASWSEELIGAIWATAWTAHLVKSGVGAAHQRREDISGGT